MTRYPTEGGVGSKEETRRSKLKNEQIDEIRRRLELGPMARSDFSDIPHRTFYTRMKELVNSGQARPAGRGQFVSADYDPLIGELVGCFEEVAYNTPFSLIPKQGVLRWAGNPMTLKKLAKLRGKSPEDPRFTESYWKAYSLFRQRFDPRRSWARSDVELRQITKQEEEYAKMMDDHPEKIDAQEKLSYRKELKDWNKLGRVGPRPIPPIEVTTTLMKSSRARRLPFPLDILESESSRGRNQK